MYWKNEGSHTKQEVYYGPGFLLLRQLRVAFLLGLVETKKKFICCFGHFIGLRWGEGTPSAYSIEARFALFVGQCFPRGEHFSYTKEECDSNVALFLLSLYAISFAQNKENPLYFGVVTPARMRTSLDQIILGEQLYFHGRFYRDKADTLQQSTPEAQLNQASIIINKLKIHLCTIVGMLEKQLLTKDSNLELIIVKRINVPGKSFDFHKNSVSMILLWS